MRISTRLAVTISSIVAVIVLLYGVVAQRQREEIIRAAVVSETEVLARTLQIVAEGALRDGGGREDLNALLARVRENPATFAALVLDERGVVFGGADHDPACLRSAVVATAASELRHGWADCGGRVLWVTLALQEPGASLVIARRATVLQRDIRSSRLRHLALLLVLIVTTCVAIPLTLQRLLSKPLGRLIEGFRSPGGAGPPLANEVGRSAGELRTLAEAFDEMAAQLATDRSRLLKETEERLALEERLLESEKFAMVGRLSGGLAHELGSPLNVIELRAETVLGHPSTPPEVRHQAAEIVAEVERIASLVQGLLHVARRHGVERRPLDLRGVVRTAAAELEPAALAADISLQLQVPDTPLLVAGDATLLRHAILNLVKNSIQALTGHAGERLVLLTTAEDGGQVRLTVEDTGPGIGSEHIRHIFEPFYTTKDVGEGTGLGLAVSRGIVEEHRGSLAVEPREGGGIRATVRLPREGSLPPEHDAA